MLQLKRSQLEFVYNASPTGRHGRPSRSCQPGATSLRKLHTPQTLLTYVLDGYSDPGSQDICRPRFDLLQNISDLGILHLRLHLRRDYLTYRGCHLRDWRCNFWVPEPAPCLGCHRSDFLQILRHQQISGAISYQRGSNLLGPMSCSSGGNVLHDGPDTTIEQVNEAIAIAVGQHHAVAASEWQVTFHASRGTHTHGRAIFHLEQICKHRGSALPLDSTSTRRPHAPTKVSSGMIRFVCQGATFSMAHVAF